MHLLIELFRYPFILKAIFVGTLVSVCAALIGVPLVLKRFSMIGDGLAHVGFGALSISMVLGFTPFALSIPIVVIASFLLLQISQNSKIKGDAAIAIISSSSMAIGIIITTLNRGFNIDVSNYMFGSVLAMSNTDVYLSVILSIGVVTLFLVFYNKLFAVTFDENYAKAIGINVSLYKTVLACLTAIIIVLGMRIMGTLLISSLIIFPALTSMRLFESFKTVVISSVFVSVICFFFGIAASYVWGLPAGASIVIINLLIFSLFSIISYIKKTP